jgi:hypothetical protein
MINYKKFSKTNHITFFSNYKIKLAEAGAKETEDFKSLHNFIREILFKFEDNKKERGIDANYLLYQKIVQTIWYSSLSKDNKIRMIDYYDLNIYVPKHIEKEVKKAWEDLSDRMNGVRSKDNTLDSVENINCSFCNPTSKCIIQ